MARIISIFGLVIFILFIAPLYWILRSIVNQHIGLTLPLADIVFWIYVLCVMVFTVYAIGSQNREKKLTFSVSVLKRRLFLFFFCEMTAFMLGFVSYAVNYPEMSVPFGIPPGVALFLYKLYFIFVIVFLILAIIKATVFHRRNQ
jgi:hypothetical protein